MTTKAAKTAQTARDLKLLEATRTLFNSPSKDDVEEDYCGESDDEIRTVNTFAEEKAATSSDASKSINMLNILNTCSCGVCKELKKHSSESTRMLMQTLVGVFALNQSQGVRYLELAQIPEDEPLVELTKRKGVFIAVSDKNQIKIDCKHQPAKMVKETLFVLFGKEPFRQGQVTARGNRSGTYGIRPNVLSALLGFVNRNAGEQKQLSLTDLNAIINKRGSDWRKEVDKTVIRQPKTAPATQSSPAYEPPPETQQLPTRQTSSSNEHPDLVNQGRKNISPEKKKEYDDLESLLGLLPVTSGRTPVKVLSSFMSVERSATFSPASCKENRMHPYAMSPNQSTVRSLIQHCDTGTHRNQYATQLPQQQAAYPPQQQAAYLPQPVYTTSQYPFSTTQQYSLPSSQHYPFPQGQHYAMSSYFPPQQQQHPQMSEPSSVPSGVEPMTVKVSEKAVALRFSSLTESEERGQTPVTA